MIKNYKWKEGEVYSVGNPIFVGDNKWYPVHKTLYKSAQKIKCDTTNYRCAVTNYHEYIIAVANYHKYIIIVLDTETIIEIFDPIQESNVEYFQTAQEAYQYCQDNTFTEEHEIEYFDFNRTEEFKKKQSTPLIKEESTNTPGLFGRLFSWNS